MPLINLETICAEYGFKIAAEEKDVDNNIKITDKENVVTKALGVLAENGFYAMTVFLLSCKFSRYGTFIAKTIVDMLASEKVAICTKKTQNLDMLQEVRILTGNLQQLILARRITEQALTFARYQCKAMNKSGKES